MRKDRLLAVFLLVGILTASWICFDRFKMESKNKVYKIAVDYEQMLALAHEGDGFQTYADTFLKNNVRAVAIEEETIESMLNNPKFGIKAEMNGYDLTVTGKSESLSFIEKGLRDTLKKDRKIVRVDEHTLVIKGEEEDLIYCYGDAKDIYKGGLYSAVTWRGLILSDLGLGYSDEKIKTISDAKMIPLLRPLYNSSYQDAKKTAERYFNSREKVYESVKQNYSREEYDNETNYIICSGDEWLSYDQPEILYQNMLDKDVNLALIERNILSKSQISKGQNELPKTSHYRAVKLFTTWDYIQRRFDYEIPGHHKGEEIVNTFYRAVLDRNVRIIYFKPYIKPNNKFVTDPAIYDATLKSLSSRLLKHGYVMDGKLKALPNRSVNNIKKIPIVAAIIASFLLLLINIYPLKKKIVYALQIVGTLFFAAIFALNIKTDTFSSLFALLSSIVSASLSVCYIIAESKKIYVADKKIKHPIMLSFLKLLVCISMSVTSAFFIPALLSDSRYMLDLKTFSGVKISQLTPMMISVILYLTYFGLGKRFTAENKLRWADVKAVLDKNIKVWQVILLGMLGILALIFMIRSGNSSEVKPATLELLFRNFLENHFIARPRNKSILLGFPATMLFIYLSYKKSFKPLYPLLAIFTAIGQSNIQNTFSHIRTPLYLSISRVGGEFLVSLFTGTIAMLIFSFIIKQFKKIKSEIKNV